MPARTRTGTPASSSQPFLRLAKGFNQVVQERRCPRAIHDAVVAGKSQRHHRPNARLTGDWHHAICDASHGENGGLRRADDGAESVDLIHAKIADGESWVRDIGRAQTAGRRPLGQITDACAAISPSAAMFALGITAATTPSSTAIATRDVHLGVEAGSRRCSSWHSCADV